MRQFTITAIIAIAAVSPCFAEGCLMYPPGPQRFACASAIQPGLIEKRERCKQEAMEMGMRKQRGEGGAFKEQVVACMQRRR
jgi:hypothetical protein